MLIKKIVGYSGVAQNISGSGNIEFNLFTNGKGELYVQLEKSEGGGNATKGMLFSVSEHASLSKNRAGVKSLRGYDLSSGDFRSTESSNNVGFLAAVLLHLLPNKE